MAKKISTYGIFTALCIVIGFIEHLLPLDFIAPGIKLGLANTVSLLLIFKNDFKGAFLVNTARIFISALLFSSPHTLAYSLTAGTVSFMITILLYKIKAFSVEGVSVCSALTHNLTQMIVASFIIGIGVWYYFPVLAISAVLGGIVTGAAAKLMDKRIKM